MAGPGSRFSLSGAKCEAWKLVQGGMVSGRAQEGGADECERL